MRFETSTRPLRVLVQQFNKGEILLPQFQRDYVWKPNKIRNLLDSLLRGFPIGGFYLWLPSSKAWEFKQKAFGKQTPASKFEGYLIDGQQRLTSLEAAFSLFTGEDKNGEELRCFLDLDAADEKRRITNLFVSYAGNKSIAYRSDVADSTLIPLASLLEGQNYDLRKKTEEAIRMKGWTNKRVEIALTRFDDACQMLGLEVPVTTVHEAEIKEAVEVFSRLNKGGSALRQGDVSAAELACGDAVNVLKSMRNFVAGERPLRLGFGFSFAFRALVVFHRGSAQFSSLKADWMDAPGPRGRSLAQSWNAAKQALERALQFVDERMGWSRRALLPSANAVIVLAWALDKSTFKLDADTEQLYRRWLCLTSLRGSFQGSVETTINRFVRAVRESKGKPAKILVDALKKDESRKLRADEFNKFAQPWGPATQVLHSWLVCQESKDWLTDQTINELTRIDGAKLPGGELTVHHLFPRRLLADFVENPDEANKAANYGLLSRATNAEFGDTRPDEVLARLKPNQRELADVQFFGEGAGDRLKPENYQDFCQWRAERLAQSINEWLGIV
jgi:hypothetical protein